MDLKDFKNTLIELLGNLDNELIKKNIATRDKTFDFDILINAIRNYINNINILFESSNDELVNQIIAKAKALLKLTYEEHIQLQAVKFTQYGNFLIKNTPKPKKETFPLSNETSSDKRSMQQKYDDTFTYLLNTQKGFSITAKDCLFDNYEDFKTIIDELEKNDMINKGTWTLSGDYFFSGLTFQGTATLEKKQNILKNNSINYVEDNYVEDGYIEAQTIEPLYDKLDFHGMRESGSVMSTKEYTIAEYEYKDFRLIEVAENIKAHVPNHFILYDYKGNIQTNNKKALEVLNGLYPNNADIDGDSLIIWDDLLDIQSISTKKKNIATNFKSEREASLHIINYLKDVGYPAGALIEDHKLFNTKHRVDISILYNNQIIAAIEIKKTNKISSSTQQNNIQAQYSQQLNSYFHTITQNQKLIPQMFIVFYADDVSTFYEYNTTDNTIFKHENFPKYESLTTLVDDNKQIVINEQEFLDWETFTKNININKLKSIVRGVKDTNFEEGIKVRNYLSTLAYKLNEEIPELKDFQFKLNSATTQPQWTPDNGFRLSFYKGQELLKSTQLNITLWSSWGGAIFIKDNQKLLLNNKELREPISKLYNVEFNESNLHITALSFKDKFPSFSEVIKSIKVLISVFNELHEKNNYSAETEYKNHKNTYASFNKDIPHENDIDSLDIDKDVSAFAKLITYKELPTPLSIGLFGKWGSGKSFFMEKLSSKIKELSRNKDDNTFCNDVVHVKFNAWHYSDTNLLASLVYKIFSEIDNTINKLTNTDKSEVQKSILYSELESSKKAILEKTKEQDELQNKISKFNTKIVDTQEKFDNTKDDLKALEMFDYGKLIVNEPEIKKDLDAIKSKLLIDNELDLQNLEMIKDTYNDLTTFSGSIKKAATLIYNDKKFLKTVLLIALPFIIICLLILIYLPDSWKLTSLVTLLPAIGLIGKQLKKIKPIIDNLNKVITKWEIIQKKKREAHYDEIAHKREFQQQLENELHESNLKIKELQDIKEKIEYDIEDIKNGKYFKEFILSRVSSTDYTKHLGLISLIRDDFTELETFLLSSKNNKDYNIDRIVLYIDDLDRCSDELVTDVLEAIHLLLAFKLFVVVVGVDSRWISGSLKNKHANLNNDDISITPNQYIEKIFQIPFKIKPLNKEDKQKFVRDLLEENYSDDKQSIQVNTDSISTQTTINEDVDTNINSQVPIISDTHDIVDEDNSPVDKKEIHEKLQLTVDEIKYIEKISNYIGETPRTIKRFINIYRIIRTHDDTSKILEDSFDNYKMILLLLCETFWKERSKKKFVDILNKDIKKYYEQFDKEKQIRLNQFIERFSFNN